MRTALIGIFSCLLITTSSWANTEDPSASLKKTLKTIKTLEADLERSRGDLKSQEKKLSEIDTTLGALLKEIHDLDRAIQRKDSIVKELSRQAQHYDKEKHTHQKQLSALIQQIARQGRDQKLRHLLQQETLQQIQRTRRYYPYIEAAYRNRLLELIDQLDAIEKAKHSQQAEQDKLLALHEERSFKKQSITPTQKKQQAFVEALHKTIQNKETKLKAAYEQQVALEEVLMKLQAVLPGRLADNKPLATLKGRLPYPVNFDALPKLSRKQGVLFPAASNTPVTAISGGRVVFSHWLRGFGLMMIIDHGDGLLSLYGHNQTLYAEVGDEVAAGEVIALVGQSGGQLKSGLYFEIRENGHPTKLSDWLIPTTL